MDYTECFSGCTLVLGFGDGGFLELLLDCTECLDGGTWFWASGALVVVLVLVYA